MKSVKISGVLLYLFGFVLILLLYVNYVFFPLNQKVAALNMEHAADTAQIQSYDRQISNIGELKQNIADTKTKLAKAELNTGVTGKNVAEDIGQAFKAVGIKPQSVTVGDKTVEETKTSAENKKLCSVSVDLSFQCTSAQLSQLLHYFEKQSKGVYYINNISYAQGMDKSSVGLSMTLYYFSLEGVKQ